MPRYLPTVGRFDFAWTDDEKHPVDVLKEEWDDAVALFDTTLSLPQLHLAQNLKDSQFFKFMPSSKKFLLKKGNRIFLLHQMVDSEDKALIMRLSASGGGLRRSLNSPKGRRGMKA